MDAKIEGTYKIRNEFKKLFTKAQAGFSYTALRRPDGMWAIYPHKTLATGRRVTFGQEARHSTVAEPEILERIS